MAVDRHHLVEGGSDVATQAMRALSDWSRVVVAVPSLVPRADHAQQVGELVGWYGRVSRAAEYCEPPPVRGLDALVDELTGATSDEAFRRLGLARWAVRVAEEVVRVRDCLATGAPPATARVAMSRLELAFTTARRHLDATGGGTLGHGVPH